MTLGRISGLTAWAAIGAAWALPPNPAIEAAPAIEVPAPSREAEAPVAKPGPQRYAAGFAPVMDEADQWAVAHLSFPELPPPEFDGPAKTAIWVTDIPSERELREACGWAERKPGEGHLVGCARRMTGGEWSVFLGREVTMRAYGLTKNIVIRHEVGHVNGWGADHPGGVARRGETSGRAGRGDAVTQGEAGVRAQPRSRISSNEADRR